MKRSRKAPFAGLMGVALATALLVAPATTPVAHAATNRVIAVGPMDGLPIYEPTRSYEFNSAEFNSDEPDWTDRMLGDYAAKGRRCSAPRRDQRVMANGYMTLKVSHEQDSSIRAARKATCVASLTSKGNSSAVKNVGKKFNIYQPVYRNAMLSTQSSYVISTGTVAARVKFSADRGSHGGVWLQSVGGSEIDFIESYGYGKAVTSVVHTRYSNGKTKENKLYSKKQKRGWYDQYHVFAVTWDQTMLTFRIDGTVVKAKNLATSGPYFLVMSQLSSDWELDKMPARVRTNQSSTQMSVDWIRTWAN